MKGVRFWAEPQFHRPVLLAAWPGVGQVALRGVSYLREKLSATALAELDPKPYLDLPGVFVEENLIQPPRFPSFEFSYWHHPNGGRDLILFTAQAQPSLHPYDLAHQVLDVVRSFGVQTVYTLAAALVSELPQKPQVWAAVGSPHQVEELRKYGALLKGDFYIAGMNGVLLGVAIEQGMEAACLLGETPRIAPHLENPEASAAVLEVLTRHLDLPVDLSELHQEARQARAELERFLVESRKEFIDRFTIPLWEQGDEEEKA